MLAGITKYPVKYIPYKLLDITEGDDLTTIQLKMFESEKKILLLKLNWTSSEGLEILAE